MHPTQTNEIVSLVGALWPRLSLTDGEKQAWGRVLRRLDYRDTLDAVEQLATERTTITVAHIGQRAERIRRERLSNVRELDLEPPEEILDDGALWAEWLRTARSRASRVPA